MEKTPFYDTALLLLEEFITNNIDGDDFADIIQEVLDIRNGSDEFSTIKEMIEFVEQIDSRIPYMDGVVLYTLVDLYKLQYKEIEYKGHI